MSGPRVVITGTSKPHLWYAGLIGCSVPYLGMIDGDFRSIDRDGFLNVVFACDGRLIEPGGTDAASRD